ncbi:MAG: hypothetical protein BWY25_02952 [Chloroflexi bacterium ADurb.Bin222]|nr:MAG: hypothetical protein BWY25_02952 [Chloroflexi bacterium ADurb.Bin222]
MLHLLFEGFLGQASQRQPNFPEAHFLHREGRATFRRAQGDLKLSLDFLAGDEERQLNALAFQHRALDRRREGDGAALKGERDVVESLHVLHCCLQGCVGVFLADDDADARLRFQAFP